MRLSESVDFTKNKGHDRENGIVFGVKILGEKSKHGYRYSTKGMKEAVDLYEDAPVNVDHLKKGERERSYGSRFGHLTKVRYVEGKKALFGDLHYNKEHRLAKQFAYDVDHAPHRVGLSHDADGSESGTGSDRVIESIERVFSVDVVADPATNIGLRESYGVRGMKVRRSDKRGKSSKRERLLRFRNFAESLSRDKSVSIKVRKNLRRLAEAVGEEGADASAGPPTQEQAMGQMIMAVFMDTSLDMKKKKEKIIKLMELDDATSTDGEAGKDGAAETPVTESRRRRKESRREDDEDEDADEEEGDDKTKIAKLTRKLESMERLDKCRRLCESAGYRPTESVLRAMVKMKGPKEVREFIADIKDTSKGGKRIVRESAPRSTSSRRPEEKFNPKSWAARLRR